MTLSKNQQLFLRVNALTGRWPALDIVMILIAHGLVYVIIAGLVFWAYTTFDQTRLFFFFFMAVSAYGIGYALNYGIAVVYRHRRPVKELPNIRTLVRTLGTWKTFPSDHAMTSAVPVALAVAFGAPFALAGAFAIGAFLVSVSRVYVGVHYPRDVVGGLIVGIASVIVAFTL